MFRTKTSQTIANVLSDQEKLEQLLSLMLPDEVSELDQLGAQHCRRKRQASGRSHSISAKF
ncbi:hypothetical protein OAG1_41670 [Agarivorans sp. OAG1]|uniref:Uncharacterized protein n=1 Tax=Agarivorans albus MKT 106 TaxID=1331007 RepID=R9PGG4_AGAAL|nr:MULTISPECIES: hypothetical protein [Agarivorans]MPW31180.1 hypothetical protein [Agarivorans sp. B2Z047]UQN42851.1 hypothetical protein LQZ07_24280 [Agarivorans sp. B2Z047]BEU05367.1 hypothetical protein OAG1_41670 [Agarivorans sp. OAG1]GAD00469.1 hypothetical protein AALB_0549 [Agarivorans albus MKT 106]